MFKSLTTELFIAKAIERHGDKYDYTNTVYLGNREKVSVYCKRCKTDFEPTAANHIRARASGCPTCAHKDSNQKKKTSKDAFVKKARAVHGDKYDYGELTLANGVKAKEPIKCNTCTNIFNQTLSQHLNGRGCPKCHHAKCGAYRKLTKEAFIEKSRERHGDLYDYSKVEYKNNNEKVLIACRQCGHNFHQVAGNHLHGHGCMPCFRKRKRLGTDRFVQKAVAVHGDLYDYSKVEYKTAFDKVQIFCKKCQESFEQMPYSHLEGRGCHTCGWERAKILIANTTEEFIERAVLAHGDKYDYSAVRYKTSKHKVSIFCKQCQSCFFQSAGDHMSGSGCPTCADNSIEPTKIGRVYKISCSACPEMFYVGITSKTIKARFSQHISDALRERITTPLAQAIRQYGKDAFTIEVLETAEALQLGHLEQKWIDKLGTKYPDGFNVAPGGNGFRIKSDRPISPRQLRLFDNAG